MAKKEDPAPVYAAFNIYRPSYGEGGALVGVDLVETYRLGPSDQVPPVGARLQSLEVTTGIAHHAEPVELAKAPQGIVAKAAEGARALAQAEAARQAEEAAAAERARAEAEAAAKARIAALIDPEGHARAQAAAAIEAEHDALAPFAEGEEADKLEAVKAARLAALEPAAGEAAEA